MAVMLGLLAFLDVLDDAVDLLVLEDDAALVLCHDGPHAKKGPATVEGEE